MLVLVLVLVVLMLVVLMLVVLVLVLVLSDVHWRLAQVAELSVRDASVGEPVAEVQVKDGMSIVTIIANVKRSSDVMAAVFKILAEEKIQVC